MHRACWYRHSAILAVLSIAAGCSDDGPSRPIREFRIAGHVVNSSGEPVVGAAVLLEYDSAPTPPPGGMFGAGDIVEIRDGCVSAVVFTDTLDVGGIYIWSGTSNDGEHCPEGVYYIGSSGSSMTLPFFLDRSRPADAANYYLISSDEARRLYRVHAWTDADGRFDLTDQCLAFGRSSIVCSPDYLAIFGEFTLEWRARLWFYDVDHESGRPSPWRDVDETLGAYFDVALNP